MSYFALKFRACMEKSQGLNLITANDSGCTLYVQYIVQYMINQICVATSLWTLLWPALPSITCHVSVYLYSLWSVLGVVVLWGQIQSRPHQRLGAVIITADRWAGVGQALLLRLVRQHLKVILIVNLAALLAVWQYCGITGCLLTLERKSVVISTLGKTRKSIESGPWVQYYHITKCNTVLWWASENKQTNK